MASLPRAAAQGGVTSILAALGNAPAADAGTGGPAAGGFAQLLSALPRAGDAGQGNAATLPLPVEADPIDLPVAEAVEADPAAVTIEHPTATADTKDAAAIATLLIRAAAGEVDASADAAEAAPGPAHLPGDAVKDEEPGDAPAPAVDGDAVADPAVPVALPVAAMPTTTRAGRTDKPTDTPRSAEIATIAQPATKAQDNAAAPAPLPGSDAKAAKPAETGGASMTVIFGQSAAQAAATVADAAKAAPVAERVLDTSSDDAWIAQLAADIAATRSQDGDLSFRLMPRHLGRLDVAMTRGDEGVSVRLDTQHEATATIVHAAQGKLVEDLRQQGVRVAGAEVTCTPNETGRQSQGQGRAPAPSAAHLIETGDARPASPGEAGAADRRGRFA